MTAARLAFLLYALAALGLGWRARRRLTAASARAATGADEFWTAGRRLGPLAVGLSISAGFLSVSWSCVYAVQLFYWYGLGAFWLMTLPWVLALAGIYALARRYRSLPAFSQPEMIVKRFGPTAGRLVAGSLAAVFLVWGGAEIYVAANLLSPQLELGTTATILLISAVVAGYATVGGFGAVVDTDKLQYGVVVLYLLAMLWLAGRGLGEVAGGWASLVSRPPAAAKTGGSWLLLLGPGAATILLTFVAYLPGWLFETDLWLRVQAARDAAAARRGIVFAAVNSLLFVGLVPLAIGAAALAIFPAEGGVVPAELGAEGDAVFAALVARFAPAWLALFVAVGLVAAAMSTIDTCVNVMALSVSRDLLGGRGGSRGAAVVTLGSVAAATLFALYTESLWDIFYLSSGILTTAVAFPVASVFLPRVGRRAVVASSAAGLAVTVAAYFAETRGWSASFEPAWLLETGVGFILWGSLAAVAGALFGSVLDRRPARG